MFSNLALGAKDDLLDQLFLFNGLYTNQKKAGQEKSTLQSVTFLACARSENGDPNSGMMKPLLETATIILMVSSTRRSR